MLANYWEACYAMETKQFDNFRKATYEDWEKRQKQEYASKWVDRWLEDDLNWDKV